LLRRHHHRALTADCHLAGIIHFRSRAAGLRAFHLSDKAKQKTKIDPLGASVAGLVRIIHRDDRSAPRMPFNGDRFSGFAHEAGR
jgi:hypothetical protein